VPKIASRSARDFRSLLGGRAPAPLPSAGRAAAATRSAGLDKAPAASNKPFWSPGTVDLRIPDSLAKRIAKAVAAQRFDWEPEIRLGDDPDIAVIHRIVSVNPRHHIDLLYFDPKHLDYPSWYLSSLCVRVYWKSKVEKCFGPPSMVLLVPDHGWFDRCTLELQRCRHAGLLRELTISVLRDWNDFEVNDRVQEWTSELKNAPAQPTPAVLAPPRMRAPRYFVFVASPGDTEIERKEVERFFKEESARCLHRGFSFEVLTWERFADSGMGDPQKSVFEDVLKLEYAPLVLVIFILKHRFGGNARRLSGTKQEWEKALELRGKDEKPKLEIKLFYSEEAFQVPPSDPKWKEKMDQFTAVMEFREEQERKHPALVAKFNANFTDVFRRDVGMWLSRSDREWNSDVQATENPKIGWQLSEQA
jgi:hypothetical protein